ncbi:GNAT family N-acetyltransferase [Jannaschia sp. CCS1]|uniref:GNAT family N-acetyltransferase n=1 Tax=Jannaschia sp. (strain CCS1) TaxID=290400 RepID=UPI000053CCE5|nr:GNAT family N-acetyltransferase [Jannaschia sp. CCS1]ABD54708.1 hypothetical protein Jann_1791 [Jannaschia sp. CCS1]
MFDALPEFHRPPSLPRAVRPTALQQSALWLSATRLLGSNAEMVDLGTRRALVLRRRLKIIGDLALLSRAELGMSPGDLTALRHHLGTRHLAVNAETMEDADALARAGFRRICAPRAIAELTLDASSDVMSARLAQKWRNRLRHGQSQNLMIQRRPMQPDKRFWLFRAEALQSLRKWYRPLAPEMVAAMAASKPGAVQVFTAYHLGRRVAAMLFVRHGLQATYQIGWSTPEGRKLSAGPALMWRAMVELQAMGTDRIDLGAADKRLAPGLARFKCGTGAEIRQLGGTWVDSGWRFRPAQHTMAEVA